MPSLNAPQNCHSSHIIQTVTAAEYFLNKNTLGDNSTKNIAMITSIQDIMNRPECLFCQIRYGGVQ